MDNGLEANLQPGLWRGGPTGITRSSSTAEARVATRVEPAFAARWDELAARVDASPYLRPGWISAWWRAFGVGTLEIHTLERDGRLIALVPLARRHGALRSVTNPHTPEFGVLAEDRPAAIALARSVFSSASPRRVSIASLDPERHELDACRRAADEAGYRISVRFFQCSPFLEVDRGWDAYEAAWSNGFAAGLRRSSRQLERMGPTTVEITDGHDRLEPLLEEAFAVESSGWKGERGTAIRAHAETRDFYTEIARWAVSHDLLRLFFLRLDGRTLAMYFALEQNGVLYLLKGGYDPAYRRVSPGKLLLHRVVEHAFHTGARRIEFHGGADDYKLRFTRTVRERVIFEAFSSSAAGRLDWSVFRYGRPVAKRLLGRPSALDGADPWAVPKSSVDPNRGERP